MKRILSLVAALALVLTSFSVFAEDYPERAYTQKFWDVPKDHWSFKYVADLAERGVINGYEDGSFKPSKVITRAEWAKLMVTVAGLPLKDNVTVSFSDMKDHWALKYVETAKDFLTAYTDGTYKPDQAITREDVAMSVVKMKKYDLESADYEYLLKYSDFASISPIMRPYICLAVMHDVITGYEDSTLRCQATLTRAEAATVLYRAFQTGNPNKVQVDSVEPYVFTDTPPAEQPAATTATEEIIDNKNDSEETEKASSDVTSNKFDYKITTIINCDINGDAYYYETDGKNLYYADNAGAIKKYDFDEQKSTTILELKELDIDTEDEAFADFEVYSLAYDADANKIYVQGRYNEVNSPNYDGALWIYLIDLDGTYELTTDYWIGTYDDQSGIGSKVVFSRIISAYSDYFVEEHALLTKDFDYIGTICDSVGDYTYGYILDSKMNGDTLNFTAFTKGWYNTKRLFEYKQGKVSTLQEFSSSATAIGLNSKNVVIAENNTLTSYNYKGKKNYVIDNTNLDGAGLTGLDTKVFASKIIVLDNNNLVVYDTRDKAFKYIEAI